MPERRAKGVSRVLISENEVQQRIGEIARELDAILCG